MVPPGSVCFGRATRCVEIAYTLSNCCVALGVVVLGRDAALVLVLARASLGLHASVEFVVAERQVTAPAPALVGIALVATRVVTQAVMSIRAESLLVKRQLRVFVALTGGNRSAHAVLGVTHLPVSAVAVRIADLKRRLFNAGIDVAGLASGTKELICSITSESAASVCRNFDTLAVRQQADPVTCAVIVDISWSGNNKRTAGTSPLSLGISALPFHSGEGVGKAFQIALAL